MPEIETDAIAFDRRRALGGLLVAGLGLALPGLAQGQTARQTTSPEFGAEVQLAPRPVLRLRGQSVWDEGFANLKRAIGLLRDESNRTGLRIAGQALAHFLDSDDLGFTYEALLPVEGAPGVGFAPGFELATSPEGRAVRFRHEGAYDDLDAAYEAITAWIDDRSFAATGRFLEEYEFLPEQQADPGLRMNIFVFLR